MELDCLLGLKVPAGHSVQEEAPIVSEKVPGAHSEKLRASSTVLGIASTDSCSRRLLKLALPLPVGRLGRLLNRLRTQCLESVE